MEGVTVLRKSGGLPLRGGKPNVGLGLLAWMACLLLSFLTTTGRPVVVIETYVSGLAHPVAIKNAGDGSGRLFVVERGGRIRIVKNGELRPGPFLELIDRVDPSGEGGLLGLAFHPDFKTTGQFFVVYTTSQAGPLRTVLSRMHVDQATPDRASSEEDVLLEINQHTDMHKAGEIAFGQDGFLYMSVGDGGLREELGDLAQDLSSLLGKILRIDVNQTSYAIPQDNPFVGQPGVREEIWALGFRNPFRMSIDSLTGRVFTGDVGERAVEEVDLVEKGKNFGWGLVEGDICFPRGAACDVRDFEAPIATYGRRRGEDGRITSSAVIGGLVYRGRQMPDFWGRYFFNDFVSGQVWTLQEIHRDSWRRRQVGLAGRLTSCLGEDEQGELYACRFVPGEVGALRAQWLENFPQIAAGRFGRYRIETRIDLLNTSHSAASGSVLFFDPLGKSARVRVNGSETANHAVEIPPGASRTLVISGLEGPFQGWALALLDRGVTGATRFVMESDGQGIEQLATVGSAVWTRRMRIPVERSSRVGAAFAMTNPWDFVASVRITARGLDPSGEALQMVVEPRQQKIFLVDQVPGVTDSFQGVIVIESDEEIAVTGVATVDGFAFSGLVIAAQD